LSANTTYGIALVLDGSHSHSYTNGNGSNENFSNDDLSMQLGAASNAPFDGGAFSPRVFNGGVYYESAISSTMDLDCSNLGENSIDVTVTDAGGNEATCTATVIVLDETAPVIVCGPEPLLYGSNSVSDSPALAIPDNNPSGVTTTIEVTDDFTLTDVNVPMNISHTWIGDLYITLTSPMGTEVVLWNRTGGSTQDINQTFDDEGTAGEEALSAFDGESSMGTWTLFVSDNAGADTGTINSWGIEYEYSYPNPEADLFIELGPDGTVTLEPMDVLSTLDEACEVDVMLLDITEFSCDDIGTPILVTVFVNDTSGNFASCQIEVNIVDNMEPELVCPDPSIYGIEPSNNDGIYEVRDYFGIGAATYSDNCTDSGSLIVTQTPAPGTSWGINGSGNPGPYEVIFTVTDGNGNTAECILEVIVTNGIGVSENTLLENALALYPNPANDVVRLVNTSEIALESAMIYDLNGKLVAQVDLSDMQTERTIDISDFASGVYMVKIYGDNANTVKRLVKK
jgi:subtilisin-like proprotein convertase family protein